MDLSTAQSNQYQNLAGNPAAFDLSTVKQLPQSPLKGMNIAFLGSSVTRGHSAEGISFVEFICRRNGCTYTKEAVSGTTMSDITANSYIQRMVHNLSASAKYDLFVCQLSTNDATQECPLGTITPDFELSAFATSTVTGAMEYIICYAHNTWNCPIVFYTNPQYESNRYKEMIEILNNLKNKWQITIIDLWNLLDKSSVDIDLYMADAIHPTKAGYLEWWTPAMEQALYGIATQKDI